MGSVSIAVDRPAGDKGMILDTLNREPGFPFHDGEMAGRIFGFDWPMTVLSPIAGWLQSLKTGTAMTLDYPLAI